MRGIKPMLTPFILVLISVGCCRDSGTKISRSVHLCGSSCIGADSVIHDQARIKSSVLGPGCVVGKSAVIDGSYVGRNVVIGEEAIVRHAFLADGVVVKSGAIVEVSKERPLPSVFFVSAFNLTT